MARMTPQTNRFDPYRNFRFRVKWDGQYVAGLTKMGALKRTTEMVEFREAGENITSRMLPGKTSYVAVTQLLAECVKSLGDETPGLELARRLLVGDRDYLMVQLRRVTLGDAVSA